MNREDRVAFGIPEPPDRMIRSFQDFEDRMIRALTPIVEKARQDLRARKRSRHYFGYFVSSAVRKVCQRTLSSHGDSND